MVKITKTGTNPHNEVPMKPRTKGKKLQAIERELAKPIPQPIPQSIPEKFDNPPGKLISCVVLIGDTPSMNKAIYF